MRYAFIAEHRDRFGVRAKCRCLAVQPSGYYAWQQSPLSQRAREDARQTELTRLAGIKAQIGYKRRPGNYGGKPSLTVDNTLARQFDVAATDRAWVTDITYIRTLVGFTCLAVVIDLYSRRVVGWSMQSRQTSEVVLQALHMAVWAAQTEATDIDPLGPGLAVHQLGLGSLHTSSQSSR